MLTIRVLSTVFVFSFAAVSRALDSGVQLDDAHEKYRAGDLDGALHILEPLLEADDIDRTTRQRVRELAARVLHSRGEQHFRHARGAGSGGSPCYSYGH